MKHPNPVPYLARVSIAVVCLACLPFRFPAQAASPTVRVSIQQLTNRMARLTWGPPQATLQCTPGVTGNFTNVQAATTPYTIDTRLGPVAGYRACLSVGGPPMVFLWRDTILQPGKVVIEWSPRDSPLQETRDFMQWRNPPPTPASDWFYPPTPLEPGGVFRGARLYRVKPEPAGPSASSVFSVNYPGYANLVFQVGQTIYFSFPLENTDPNLNSLLPLPLAAHGTTVRFYDPVLHQFKLPMVFDADLGWLDSGGAPAQRPAGESACEIVAHSSAPGATNVVCTMIGDLTSGVYQRTLPPGESLNGPLVPMRGGISSVHGLQPNEGDGLGLFNPTTLELEDYEFFLDEWIRLDDFSVLEPVIGPGDAFFYYNSGGLLNWTSTLISSEGVRGQVRSRGTREWSERRESPSEKYACALDRSVEHLFVPDDRQN